MTFLMCTNGTDEPAPVASQGAPRIMDATAALRRGEMVVIAEATECSLVLLGSTIATSSLARMIGAGSGVVFAALSGRRLAELAVPRMTGEGGTHSPELHIAVDAAAGIGTGISATDRAHTIRLLSDFRSTAADFVRPGHVIPVSGDISPLHRLTTAQLVLALVGTVDPAQPAAAFCALTSPVDSRRIADPDEGAQFARDGGHAFVTGDDIVGAFYRQPVPWPAVLANS